MCFKKFCVKILLITFTLNLAIINSNHVYAAENPTIIENLNAGAANSNPRFFIKLGNITIFKGTDATNGTEIWRTDGTEAGTYLIKDINPGTDSSNMFEPVVMGNYVYFRAQGENFNEELWRTDGTESGTTLVKDIKPTGSSGPYNLTVFNNKLYFVVTDDSNGIEIWSSDGTNAGTIFLIDTFAGPYSRNPKYFTVLGNKLIFTSRNKIYETDGTLGGFAAIKTINADPHNDYLETINIDNQYGINRLFVLGDYVYFMADDGTSGKELWRSNGTTSGTTLIKDINAGADSSLEYGKTYATVLNNEIYFSAFTAAEGWELWKTNGTEAGTVLVKNINPGSVDSNPTELVTFGNYVYFSADDGTNGIELWRTDGTSGGTVLVKNINSGIANGNPLGLTASGDYLYFSADDGSHGAELWRSDGTTSGTTLLLDIQSGISSGAMNWGKVDYDTIYKPNIIDSKMYFRANEGTNGFEPWVMTIVPNEAPTITISQVNPAVTTGSSPTITGTASSSTKKIYTVEYQIDSTSGDWNTCTANDGTFNSSSEPFTSAGNLEECNDVNAYTESFEGATFPPANFTTGGDADWILDSNTASSGTQSGLSGTITDDGTSYLRKTVTFATDTYLRFYWKVSSEENYDFLSFCLDNNSCSNDSGYTLEISGEVDWRQEEIFIAAGTHDLQWLYSKDGSAYDGSDLGWLDNITYTEAECNIKNYDLGSHTVYFRSNGYDMFYTPVASYTQSAFSVSTSTTTSSSTRNNFNKDSRCTDVKPVSPTWIRLEPGSKNGVAGMNLTWTQYLADKIDIKIDNGTGSYPWTINNTENDGYEFLANVTSFQNIKLLPINNCKEGDFSKPISYLKYPYGWYNN